MKKYLGKQGFNYLMQEIFKKLSAAFSKVPGEKREGGINVFNALNTNKTNLPFGFISGQGNAAHFKCFLPQKAEKDTGKIWLDSVEGIEVGMGWNIFGPDYDKTRGKVEAIDEENNCLTLKAAGELNDALTFLNLPVTGCNIKDGVIIIDGGRVGTHDAEFSDDCPFTLTMMGSNGFCGIDGFVANIGNEAPGFGAASFGYYTKSLGERAFTANYKTEASGNEAAAFNLTTKAPGKYAFSCNKATIANGAGQLVCGSFNKPDYLDENGNFYFIVGNGSSDTYRQNAFTVDKNGNTNTMAYSYSMNGYKLLSSLYAAHFTCVPLVSGVSSEFQFEMQYPLDFVKYHVDVLQDGQYKRIESDIAKGDKWVCSPLVFDVVNGIEIKLADSDDGVVLQLRAEKFFESDTGVVFGGLRVASVKESNYLKSLKK